MAKTTTDSDENQAANEDNNQPQPENVDNESADKTKKDSEPVSDSDSDDDSPIVPDESQETEVEDDTKKDEGDKSKAAEKSKTTEETDEEIKAWAAKKNLPLDDPVALAKAYREAEKKISEQGQEAAKLRKQVEKQAEDSADDQEAPDVTETRKLLNKLTVTDFYLNNPEARQYDAKMAEILKEKPYLSSDLETLLVVAKSRTSDEELEAARKEGKQEALKSASQAMRQGAPSRAATTNSAGGSDKDPFLEGLDSEPA